jgi:hypothetical protein
VGRVGGARKLTVLFCENVIMYGMAGRASLIAVGLAF